MLHQSHPAASATAITKPEPFVRLELGETVVWIVDIELHNLPSELRGTETDTDIVKDIHVGAKAGTDKHYEDGTIEHDPMCRTSRIEALSTERQPRRRLLCLDARR